MTVLLESGLQVFSFSSFSAVRRNFSGQIILVREGVGINVTHAVNAVHHSLSKVLDKEVSLLLCIIPMRWWIVCC